MIYAGIDAGSRATKVVVLEGPRGRLLGCAVTDQGVRQNELAQETLRRALSEAGVRRSAVTRIVATGYGRHAIACADDAVTEITCHARGVRHLVPGARTVIDVGGQDSKLMRLSGDGAVHDFAMNDRCAAGTGRFLEVVAARLEVPLEDLGRLARRSRRPAVISSMCVVFAETEIIGLLASGVRPADIVAGVQAALAARIASMAGRHLTGPIVFTGGVALVSGMDRALHKALGHRIRLSPQPQFTGALGAALLAAAI